MDEATNETKGTLPPSNLTPGDIKFSDEEKGWLRSALLSLGLLLMSALALGVALFSETPVYAASGFVIAAILFLSGQYTAMAFISKFIIAAAFKGADMPDFDRAKVEAKMPLFLSLSKRFFLSISIACVLLVASVFVLLSMRGLACIAISALCFYVSSLFFKRIKALVESQDSKN